LDPLASDVRGRTQADTYLSRLVLKAADVIRSRSDWVRRVSIRRDKADEIAIGHMSGTTPKQLTIEDWDKSSEAKVIGSINVLPNLRRAASGAAQPRWNTGILAEMRQGNYDAIELLERAWLHLARFYPPNQFDGKPADQFMRLEDSLGTGNFLSHLAPVRQEKLFTEL
jgi:hypothetical protein